MAKASGPKFVYCYHCGKRLEVSHLTKSTLCGSCNKTVLVEDIVVKRYHGVTNLETCGKLIVSRRGHAAAQNRLVALGGIEVKGKVHCPQALCAGKVVLGSKAEWEGDLAALSLVVEAGAVIKGGHFKVPVDPLEPHRHQEQEDDSEDD
ncbi:MAG: polymer-forming cytoskeletal protein [Planctomycetota bacterium]|jgi:hypothetical protein